MRKYMEVMEELLSIPCPKCGKMFGSVGKMTRHDVECWGIDTAYYNLTSILGINEDYNQKVSGGRSA